MTPQEMFDLCDWVTHIECPMTRAPNRTFEHKTSCAIVQITGAVCHEVEGLTTVTLGIKSLDTTTFIAGTQAYGEMNAWCKMIGELGPDWYAFFEAHLTTRKREP